MKIFYIVMTRGLGTYDETTEMHPVCFSTLEKAEEEVKNLKLAHAREQLTIEMRRAMMEQWRVNEPQPRRKDTDAFNKWSRLSAQHWISLQKVELPEMTTISESMIEEALSKKDIRIDIESMTLI